MRRSMLALLARRRGSGEVDVEGARSLPFSAVSLSRARPTLKREPPFLTDSHFLIFISLPFASLLSRLLADISATHSATSSTQSAAIAKSPSANALATIPSSSSNLVLRQYNQHLVPRRPHPPYLRQPRRLLHRSIQTRSKDTRLKRVKVTRPYRHPRPAHPAHRLAQTTITNPPLIQL